MRVRLELPNAKLSPERKSPSATAAVTECNPWDKRPHDPDLKGKQNIAEGNENADGKTQWSIIHVLGEAAQGAGR